MENKSLGHNIYKIRKIVKLIKFVILQSCNSIILQFCDFAIKISIVLRIAIF
ncbi:hypothetical protein HMPREF3230_01110 [Gardnerella vaginalis]|uniref:Uncharacterized protein n=1 Tax=Gardnerella vaginalis TaxID=2702 RepID=A0A135Z3S2_GARVA|nr:hypothetical protein HMPREF3230_01110 [Gardnerella vaginalis]